MEPSNLQEGVIVLDDKKDAQQQLRVKRKTLQAVLEQCQRALDLINSGEVDDDDDEDDGDESEVEIGEDSLNQFGDDDTVQLCNFLKSGVDSPNFLEKLGTTSASVPQNPAAEEGGSWDIVCENDLWDGEDIELDQESYVLVRQEDILEGIASFTAAYLLSLKQTKELTPNQLQEALSKTFCTKKKKGKLRKAWDGSKVIYNVASWGATAIGIYQNPALFRVATVAFWTSCRVISKLF
ncbi:hypothetical protein MKW98_004335 [Papaver atlanticum]|uniref:Uncharacterized protein n=1 Tax=Papaver atlanticum TaxID=357466 RepID=A0AAD4SPQ5_9MAGN|nr:hypothetical protein MKW98_004335 [Papaver atlanticum]